MTAVVDVVRRAVHLPALLLGVLAVVDWEGSELFADDPVLDEA